MLNNMSTPTTTYTTTLNPANLKLGEKVFIWNKDSYCIVVTGASIEAARNLVLYSIAAQTKDDSYTIVDMTRMLYENEPVILKSAFDVFIENAKHF